jgi:hypothetical protein
MWDVKQRWDDLFFTLCNGLYRLRYIKDGGARAHGLRDNIDLKNCHNNARVCVVGNGPSIQEQNLKPLANEITFFVNRGFLHSDYEFIKPKYHVFVDPKMGSGEWPLSFLDEAAEKNPDVTFLLNARWFCLPEFQECKDKYRIYWLAQTLFIQPWHRRSIDLTTIGIGGAVVEQGILAALYMGAKNIYFTGVDGNGLCYNLVGKSSHYYGSNPEDIGIGFHAITKALAMMSNSCRRWSLIDAYCQRMGAELVNLTDGGIMDCSKRERFQKIFGE